MDVAIIKKLKKIRLFAGIETPDIPHMLNCIGGYERVYRKSEYIFMEESQIQNIGVLLSGTVQMIKEDINGDKIIMTTFGSGDIFGESFVCQDAVSSTVSFLAFSNCHILFLPFRRLLTTCGLACQFHQKLIENMVVSLAQKNVQMMQKMEILSKKTIREKMLVWMSQQMKNSGTTSFHSPMGRVELAEYLCIDRSALTRELGNMKKEGLIEFEKNFFKCCSCNMDT